MITRATLGHGSFQVRKRGFPGRLLRPTSLWVAEFPSLWVPEFPGCLNSSWLSEFPGCLNSRVSEFSSLWVSEFCLNSLATYTATRSDLAASAREAVDVILEGKVKVEVRRVYPLAEAAKVRRGLEGRRTVGSIVMIP